MQTRLLERFLRYVAVPSKVTRSRLAYPLQWGQLAAGRIIAGGSEQAGTDRFGNK